MKRYKVWLRSKPGMYAQYDGSVLVWARDEEEAFRVALDRLRRGSFPDRSNSMWILEKVEFVGDYR